jgi:hypothetical protein
LRRGYGKEIEAGTDNEDEAVYTVDQCFSQEGRESRGGDCATLYPLEFRQDSQNAKDYEGDGRWHI